ncbi:MAG: hypothetical protein P8J85_02790 [Alphaproteobacteria bacterium]|nr:hypothetical protein [Alphaproteobacteria bacterium]|tara:strand:- start:462 stop:869 length:408 start_codon:yes stop_codon:yes gene_type:complete
MSTDNTFIEVTAKSYTTGLSAEISAASKFWVNGAGAYEMKMCGAWTEIWTGFKASIGTPLYGEDEIKFGLQVSFEGAKIEAKYLNADSAVLQSEIDAANAQNATANAKLIANENSLKAAGLRLAIRFRIMQNTQI